MSSYKFIHLVLIDTKTSRVSVVASSYKFIHTCVRRFDKGHRNENNIYKCQKLAHVKIHKALNKLTTSAKSISLKNRMEQIVVQLQSDIFKFWYMV